MKNKDNCTDIICSRRRLLQGLGITGATLAFHQFLPGLASATVYDPDTAPLFIHCSFDGGWDQLLALDPRDNTEFTSSSSIHAGYDVLAGSDQELNQVLSSTSGTGLVRPDGSNITFGPAVGRLADRFADLCVLRGVDMGTLTHEVGRRYFLTGKFPRGLAASGSSLSTWHAAQTGDLTPIPNLVVGMETYNEGLENFASGLSVKQSVDLLTVLMKLGIPLNDPSASAVANFLWNEKCADQLYDKSGEVTTFLDSSVKAETLGSGELAKHFMFIKNAKPDIKELYEAFDVNVGKLGQETGGAKGQAMIAAQALTKGISQSVSIQLAQGIDHHDDDYQTAHSKALRTGFNALADLIGVLKSRLDANGKPFWDRTTLICTSEFARTPKINQRGGRDHHLSSSCLLAGKGISGNQVIGATTDTDFSRQLIDFKTGELNPDGLDIRPPDVHATLLKAMGMSYEHISNQNPRILESALS